MAFTYRVLLQWSEEDDAYIATIPEWSGVNAHGDTPEQAARELQQAAHNYAAVYAEDGLVPPQPVHIRP